MSNSFSPFSSIGRYNLKNYIYENKKNVISITVIFIIILIFATYNVWSWDYHPKVLNIYTPLLRPQYGLGPYGYGTYAPPREYLDI